MASPQKENGYTPIANELMEAFAMLNLSPYEWRILHYLLRKTYGWKKSTDVISLSQFVNGTQLDKKHICRSINKLVKKKLIDKSKMSKTETAYHFNKNYHTWIIPQTGNVGSPQTGNYHVPKQGHTKETIQKKLYKRKGELNNLKTRTPIKSM